MNSLSKLVAGIAVALLVAVGSYFALVQFGMPRGPVPGSIAGAIFGLGVVLSFRNRQGSKSTDPTRNTD
jgi:hypothetical protein